MVKKFLILFFSIIFFVVSYGSHNNNKYNGCCMRYLKKEQVLYKGGEYRSSDDCGANNKITIVDNTKKEDIKKINSPQRLEDKVLKRMITNKKIFPSLLDNQHTSHNSTERIKSNLVYNPENPKKVCYDSTSGEMVVATIKLEVKKNRY